MNDRLYGERKCPSEPSVTVMGKQSAEKDNGTESQSHTLCAYNNRMEETPLKLPPCCLIGIAFRTVVFQTKHREVIKLWCFPYKFLYIGIHVS